MATIESVVVSDVTGAVRVNTRDFARTLVVRPPRPAPATVRECAGGAGFLATVEHAGSIRSLHSFFSVVGVVLSSRHVNDGGTYWRGTTVETAPKYL